MTLQQRVNGHESTLDSLCSFAESPQIYRARPLRNSRSSLSCILLTIQDTDALDSFG